MKHHFAENDTKGTAQEQMFHSTSETGDNENSLDDGCDDVVII